MEILRTFTELGADALRELDTAVVARLAPSWTASLPELLSTSLSLMGGHVTGFAA